MVIRHSLYESVLNYAKVATDSRYGHKWITRSSFHGIGRWIISFVVGPLGAIRQFRDGLWAANLWWLESSLYRQLVVVEFTSCSNQQLVIGCCIAQSCWRAISLRCLWASKGLILSRSEMRISAAMPLKLRSTSLVRRCAHLLRHR